MQSACQNNGGCSQLCVLRPNGRSCLCQAGRKIAEDGTSCKFRTLSICVLCEQRLCLRDNSAPAINMKLCLTRFVEMETTAGFPLVHLLRCYLSKRGIVRPRHKNCSILRHSLVISHNPLGFILWWRVELRFITKLMHRRPCPTDGNRKLKVSLYLHSDAIMFVIVSHRTPKQEFFSL